MALQIVWRNPTLRPGIRPRVERVVVDVYGAIYEVRSEDETYVFELLLPRAA
jgi:hypothetical protein